jgi:hypothetical protein
MQKSRALTAGSALLAAIGATAVLATGAQAGITGPCTATIAGLSVKDRSSTSKADAIRLKRHTQVAVAMASSKPISHLAIRIAFAGFHWTVKNEPTPGSSWARTLKVDDYAKWGVGLYQVTGVSSGPAVSCTGSVLVRIEGNPLGTPAGGIGLGLTILGGLGLGASVLRGAKGRGPRLGGLLDVIASLFLAIGVLTLLQQFSVVYPTAVVAIVVLVVCVLVGAIVPSLVKKLSPRGAPRTGEPPTPAPQP